MKITAEMLRAKSAQCDVFKNIAQHWAHFLERDISPMAPLVQVSEMKKAFAAGAISGFQLALLTHGDKDKLRRHFSDIKLLVKP